MCPHLSTGTETGQPDRRTFLTQLLGALKTGHRSLIQVCLNTRKTPNTIRTWMKSYVGRHTCVKAMSR